MKIKLQKVQYMPKDLEAEILYVSEEFGTAAHLCPCGCKSKIRTPLGPTDWALMVTENGPTIHPSIGNWQLPCQSHYLIIDGQVVWSLQWSPEQILVGRKAEEKRSLIYYENLYSKQNWIILRFWHWVKRLFD